MAFLSKIKVDGLYIDNDTKENIEYFDYISLALDFVMKKINQLPAKRRETFNIQTFFENNGQLSEKNTVKQKQQKDDKV